MGQFDTPPYQDMVRRTAQMKEEQRKLRMWFVGGISVVVVLVLAVSGYIYISGQRKNDAEEKMVLLKSITSAQSIVPLQEENTSEVKANTSEVKTKVSPLPEKVVEGKSAETAAATAPAEKSSRRTIRVGDYAEWTGEVKNSKPHGNGTMRFTAAHRIDSRDEKGREAQPGEYIEYAHYVDGHLDYGTWVKQDGSKEHIDIGY